MRHTVGMSVPKGSHPRFGYQGKMTAVDQDTYCPHRLGVPNVRLPLCRQSIDRRAAPARKHAACKLTIVGPKLCYEEWKFIAPTTLNGVRFAVWDPRGGEVDAAVCNGKGQLNRKQVPPCNAERSADSCPGVWQLLVWGLWVPAPSKGHKCPPQQPPERANQNRLHRCARQGIQYPREVACPENPCTPDQPSCSWDS